LTGGAPGLTNQSAARDFSPDDFPALSGGTPSVSGAVGDNHNGINGSLAFLNDSSRTRTFGGGSDVESRKFSLKTGSSNLSWTSPTSNSNAPQTTTSSTSGGGLPFSSSTLTNGISSHPGPNSLSNPPISNSVFSGLNPLSITAAAAVGAETSVNGNASGTPLPQTPAQQVLMSPADRWGLLGLLALIRSSDPEATLLGIGTDLGTMGLDMQSQGYARLPFH